MGFMDAVRSFLGIPNYQQEFKGPSYNEGYYLSPPMIPIPRHDEIPPIEEDENISINIYSNPIEIVKFFEQQMDTMRKNMNFFDGFDGFFNESFFDTPGSSHFGILEPPKKNNIDKSTNSKDLRDQYLKPGYKRQTSFDKKSDDDLDGRINMNDVDDMLKGSESRITPQVPLEERPKFHFYGQTVTSRTIRNPDGSIETHKTVRDQDGNEKTTVVRKMGEKEYTVITQIDKNGKKEIEENIINMDDSEKDKFLKKYPVEPNTSGIFERDWSEFYERFFK